MGMTSYERSGCLVVADGIVSHWALALHCGDSLDCTEPVGSSRHRASRSAFLHIAEASWKTARS